jgi:hypothetical protein
MDDSEKYTSAMEILLGAGDKVFIAHGSPCNYR